MQFKTVILVLHVLSGTLGSSAALWAMVDLKNIENGSAKRVSNACMAEFVLTLLSLLAGGLYYVLFYQDEKQIILNGPSPIAHTFFMEVKEHVFFILLLLSLYLFVITRHLHAAIDVQKIRLIKITLMAIFTLGFLMIGFGEFIDAGVKSGMSKFNN
ncbi:MAG TPA: hypothetical protein VGF79_12865 [Bacteroidia bacterium]